MPRPSCVSVCMLLAFAAAQPARAENALASRLEAVTTGPDYQQARWGILIVDGHSGDTVYAQNADRLFIPASTTKLYSCATALAVLGPDHKFETPVYRRGFLSL